MYASTITSWVILSSLLILVYLVPLHTYYPIGITQSLGLKNLSACYHSMGAASTQWAIVKS